MGWVGKRDSFTRVLSSFLILVFMVAAAPARSNGVYPEPENCAAQIGEVGQPEVPRREITFEAERFLEEIRAACESPTVCSDAQLDKAVSKAVEKSPSKFRSLFKKVKLLSRRSIVLLIWGGSILGPGVLSYYLTAGVPEGLRYSVTSFVMAMTGILFGRFSGPIDKKLGPKVEQLAFYLWKPDRDDSWGQIMKSIPETDRLKFSQTYNQIIVINPYLKEAGIELEKGNLLKAARFLNNAILNSNDMFAGLHLDHPATIREARTYLPAMNPIEKTALISIASQMIADLPDEELQDPSPAGRRVLTRFLQETLITWIQVK